MESRSRRILTGLSTRSAMSEPIPKNKPFYRNRSLRTVFLAVIATATFVGSAILIFDVDWRLMLNFFLASLLGLGVLMAAALVVVAARHLWRRRR